MRLSLSILVLFTLLIAACGDTITEADSHTSPASEAIGGKGDIWEHNNGFDAFNDVCGYADGQWCSALDHFAEYGTSRARAWFGEHGYDYQLRTTRPVPGQDGRSSIIYGIIHAPPEVVAALVSDIEALGPNLFMANGARLIVDDELDSPSRQWTARITGATPYILRQGLTQYYTGYGPGYQIAWENVAISDADDDPIMDLHGFARFEPYGPDGQMTLYRYDSYVNPTSLSRARRAARAERQFSANGPFSRHWLEGRDHIGWRLPPDRVIVRGPVANAVHSLATYVHAIAPADVRPHSPPARTVTRIFEGVRLLNAEREFWRMTDYVDARVVAMHSALENPSCTDDVCSVVWDYGERARREN